MLAHAYQTQDDRIRDLLACGRYRVTTDGVLWRRAREKKYAGDWVRTGTPTCYGYLVVHPWKGATLFVHRIVYAALIGPLQPGLEVNHKNGIKTDNRPENLELITIGENQRHARRIGLRKHLSSNRPCGCKGMGAHKGACSLHHSRRVTEAA